jgi:predicted amidophosphoribosyltransferase
MKLKRRSLILAKCPHCSEFMIRIVNPDEKAIICRKCAGTMNISKWKLYTTKTVCSCCGHRNTFITDGNLKEVVCRECKAPIDLFYNSKNKIYVSAGWGGKK